MNYLASPPLVVAYALAGRMDTDPYGERLGTGGDGSPVYLRDIWPSQREVQDAITASVNAREFRQAYQDVFAGEARWSALDSPTGKLFAW